MLCLYACSSDQHAVHLIDCIMYAGFAVPTHAVLYYVSYVCMYVRTFVCMYVCLMLMHLYFNNHIILSCNRVAISSSYLAIANYIIMSKLVYRTGAVSVVECSVV